MSKIVQKGDVPLMGGAVPEDQQSLLPSAAAKDDAEYQYWEDLTKDLIEARQWLSGSISIDGIIVPRFGVLSLKAATTPMYVYSHPALKKICSTGFTDGVHVFICVDFYKKLNDDVKRSKGENFGIEMLLMHEIMHMMFNHTRRLRQFPHDIANKAEDLFINTKLQLGFPDMKWCDTLKEIGLGFKKGDTEKYPFLAEETIARELMAERQKDPKQQQKQGQSGGQGQPQPGQGQGQQKPGQSGQGQPGQGQPQPGQGQPQNGKGGQPQNGQPQPGGNQPGKGGQKQDQKGGGGQDGEDDPANNHTISLEDFIKVLEENGLQRIIDKLNLPKSDDLEKIGEIEENTQLKDIENIQKAAAQKQQLGGKYPGAHIVDAASDMVRGFSEGKLQWKLGLQEFILGEGMKFRYNDEEPSDLYYVDEITEVLGSELYLGQDLPHNPQETVLCLIDTSGSVGDAQLKAFINEVLELKQTSSGMGDSASEVILLSADTILRGEPIEINASNVDEFIANGIKIYGRGGTDLATSLKQALKLDLLKEKKIKSVVYFTDLFDTPPKKTDFPDDIAICYVAAPHSAATHVEEFANAVKDYARVYPLEEGLVVDLTADHLSTPVNTKKSKM